MPAVLLRIFRWFTGLIALGTLLTAWLPLLSPAFCWPAGFAGILFPIFFALSLLAIVCCLLMRRRWWMVPALAVLLSFRGPMVYFGVGGLRGDAPPRPESFTVMTFNSSYMGLKAYSRDSIVSDRILALLASASPDILCMQEFYSNDRPDRRDHYLDSVRLGGNYPAQFFAVHKTQWKTWHFGTVVFSRFPIIDTARIPFNGGYANNEDLLKLRLRVHNDTVTLLVAHFASYRLDGSNYKNGPNLSMLARLRHSFGARSRQALILKKEIDATKGPVIVAGDLNDVPLSYTYHTVRGNRLQDAFLQRGFGIGRTFAALSPTLRIDYLLPDDHFEVEAVDIFRGKQLQHFPLMARLSFRRPASQ